MLGRGVRRDVGIALQAGRAGDVDDAAPAASSMSGSAAWVQRKVPVRLTASMRCQSVERGLGERGALGLAGVVDQDADRPAPLARLREARLDRRCVGDVAATIAAVAAPGSSRASGFSASSRAPDQRQPRLPSAARRRAMAAPMPRAAPVTTACGCPGESLIHTPSARLACSERRPRRTLARSRARARGCARAAPWPRGTASATSRSR